MGIKLDPDSLYNEALLRAWGFDADVLRQARAAGTLRCSDLGRNVRMYLGRDLLAWIASRREPERAGA